jgi:hypothetical protein
MKNEITTNSQYDDGFDVSEPTTGGLVKGKLLKFRDESFLIGGNEHMPENVTQLIVVSMTTLWTRWAGEGKPPTHLITRSGQSHPRRDELPDQDEALWPKGLDGKADPWADTRHVTMIHDTSAQVYTFTTSTHGGRIAVSELKDAIALRRRVRPGSCPVVELTTAPMKTRFGERLRPAFKVVGWIEPEAQAPATPPTPPTFLSPAETLKVMREGPAALASAEQLSDQIPF